jgi:uncharacterized membrane protein YkvA (DUF1232 family)
VVAIALAVRDPRVPWYAQVVGACVVASAPSPSDLIPDFVPVLRHLDDLVVAPLGLMLVLRLIPAHVLAEPHAAASVAAERPVSRAGAFAVIGVWILAALLVADWLGDGRVLGPARAVGINYSGRSHDHDQHHLRRRS